uniref:20/22 kDa protein n=1 Tax=Dirofilaria repens TaxID=31241 RepID=A0A6B9XLA0_9BILA|nr:20/22 kDa protein [Dirofilaria repens]
MNKLFIVLGLVILSVAFPSASQSEEESVSFEDSDESYAEDYEGHKEEHNDHATEDDEYVTKGKFVESDGKMKHCKTHEACYDQREPQSWCILKPHQSWTKRGCFCESKKHACVIERKSGDNLEYSYCSPRKDWQCSYD